MVIDLDDEILQDFLIEAGEILETLNEQLVDLERTPHDDDLLNSIFRGFHTVKGGAGFLSLTNLVEVCHKSEDVFNALRNHERTLDADMMDIFLHVLDEVKSMFQQIRSGQEPSPAETALIQQLINMQSAPAVVQESIKVSAKDASIEAAYMGLLAQDSKDVVAKSAADEFVSAKGDISDDEFESLLDALHGKSGAGVVDPSSANASDPRRSDDISDEEFEALLDDLHGKGKGPTARKNKEKQALSTSVAAVEVTHQGVKAERRDSVLPRGETTVRVDTSRLDDIMNLVGELVLTRNRLNTLRQTFEDERVHQAICSLDVVTTDLQSAVMKTRMQPVKKVFGRFPRVVRDLARTLNKEVALEMEGEETDLDKNLVEALADPLVHLVRNSVDHGIESPDVREKAGKPRQGKVVLSARQEGDHILLFIRDDGAGMDPEILRNNAVRKGLMDAETASRLDEKGCYDLIFLPGLTTRENISDVSGRGVGMDVVKTRIMQLNGTIDIESELGKGTELGIKVPLTLAILPTLMVQLGNRKFALPLSIVNEIFEFSSKTFSMVDGRQVVINRGKALPVFFLRKWLLNGHDSALSYEGDPHVIMVQVGNSCVGFVVDQVLGQEEVVIKPLDKLLQGLPGLAGSTITGDGNIALILDVPGLLNTYA